MKLNLVLSVFFSFALIPQAFPMTLNFNKRRFGQEHTPKADATYAAVREISLGTGKEQQAGDLSGAMVRALIAKAPACDQQDRADDIIDLAIEIGGDKKEKLIQVAKTYRQLERNTPKEGLPSELCKKKPRHEELDGLVQAQDKTEDPGPNPPTGKGKDPGPNPPKGKDPGPNPPKSKDPGPNPPKSKDPGPNPPTGKGKDPGPNPPKGPKGPKEPIVIPKDPKKPEDPEPKKPEEPKGHDDVDVDDDDDEDCEIDKDD